MDSVLVTMSDGAVVHYEEERASSDRLPVVLLHGLTQQRSYWLPVIQRLQNLGSTHIITIDQRGHGRSSDESVNAQSDFSMDRLVDDVAAVLDEAGIGQAIVVGHSWGASVALHSAVRLAGRVRAAVLIDGGLFGPRHLIADGLSHADVREALRPPPLGMMEPSLWQAIETGDLSPYWSNEIRSALAPTFRVDASGRVFTRLGMERHMAVLDGLFDYDPATDLAQLPCPAWAVICDERPSTTTSEDSDDISMAWARAKAAAVAGLPPRIFLQRWYGALHDVPLQWPALVAGLLETVVDRTSDPEGEMQ